MVSPRNARFEMAPHDTFVSTAPTCPICRPNSARWWSAVSCGFVAAMCGPRPASSSARRCSRSCSSSPRQFLRRSRCLMRPDVLSTAGGLGGVPPSADRQDGVLRATASAGGCARLTPEGSVGASFLLTRIPPQPGRGAPPIRRKADPSTTRIPTGALLAAVGFGDGAPSPTTLTAVRRGRSWRRSPTERGDCGDDVLAARYGQNVRPLLVRPDGTTRAGVPGTARRHHTRPRAPPVTPPGGVRGSERHPSRAPRRLRRGPHERSDEDANRRTPDLASDNASDRRARRVKLAAIWRAFRSARWRWRASR